MAHAALARSALEVNVFSISTTTGSSSTGTSFFSAYVDVIARANEERLKEMFMHSPTLERIIEEVCEETGLAARWEKRGEERGEERGKKCGEEQKAQEIAQSLIRKGWSGEEIAKTTGLDLETVESLLGSTV